MANIRTVLFRERSRIIQSRDVRVCVVIPFILEARLVDAPAGFTREEGHTGFLHQPSAVLGLIFVARMIQPSLFLVDRERRILCTHEIIVLHYLLRGKIPVRVTAPRFELTSCPTEPTGATDMSLSKLKYEVLL